MQNINADHKQRGLRILSLDDGGVRGLSELFILQEIMTRLMRLENLSSLPKPCDYFDIIGGAGTGGVIALMLGRLHMSIDLAIEKYISFSQEVYSDVKKWSRWGEKFRTTVFESGMKSIISCAGFSEDVLMQEDNLPCKSFVVALSSANMTPQIFRTYQIEANQGYNCTVVQAACATTATPDLFEAASIEPDGVSKTFIGGDLDYSNSTNLALEEAAMVFGLSQPVACLVNIGAGNSDHIFWKPNPTFSQRMMKLLHKVATNCEAQAEIFTKHNMQTPGLFYRLSVHQELQNMAVNSLNKQGEIKTYSLAYLQESKTTEQLNNLANTLYSCSSITTLESLCETWFTNSLNKQHELLPVVPAPSLLFTGREEILLLLEKCFDPYKSSLKMQVQQCCVLHGLDGAGKTQIALQFCHKFGSRFSFIFMIDASSKASIERSLTMLAETVKWSGTTPEAALMWLCYQKEEWLLIFDSADDLDMDLHEFFPACSHGNILITSKNEATKIYAPVNHYKIEKMSIEDSLKVFYKASQRQKTEEAAAKELVQVLDYLPLAIVQAGSYLFCNQHIEVKEYLVRCKKNMLKHLTMKTKEENDSYQLSVVATWISSYQKLDEKAKALLMLCSVLHNSKIPVSILERAWSNLSSICEVNMQELKNLLGNFVINDKKWSDELVEEAVSMLRAYSLVRIERRELIYLNIHSLVHSWAFQLLSKEEQKKAKLCGQQLFYCLGDKDLEYNDAAQWVPHIQALMICLKHKCENYKLAERLSMIFVAASFWTSAETLQQQVLDECKKMLGSSSLDTVIAMLNLASTFWRVGKWQEAENLQQEVLKVRMEFFGSSHPDTIQAMSNLAETLKYSGKLQEAENLQQEVLKVKTKSFGSSHPATIQAMSKLAETFVYGKKWQEAETFESEVLKVRRKSFGSNHPAIIQAMSNLAEIFKNSRRWQEAENLELEILKVRIEFFGSHHPDTIQAMSNLAATFKCSGKLQKAEDLEVEVLKVRTEIFGSHHLYTILAMFNLAATFRCSGKLQKAEDLELEVLKVTIESFGSSHPVTIRAKSTIATTLKDSGKLKEAENFEQEVLKVWTELFRKCYPDAFQAISNLAATFRYSGKLQEAENIEKDVLKIRKETFGSSHPDTIQAMSNLALTYWQSGQIDKAEKLEQEMLEVRIQALGKNHPDTIQAMADVATIFWHGGNIAEAKRLDQEVLELRNKVFGKTHRATLQAMSNLAATFRKDGKLEEAEVLQQEVLKIQKEAFGSSHPDTIQAMSNLTTIFWQGGKLAEAEKLNQEVFEFKKEASGSSHLADI